MLTLSLALTHSFTRTHSYSHSYSLKRCHELIKELRDALDAKGIDSTGLKAVLLARLEEAIGEGLNEGAQATAIDEDKEKERDDDVIPEPVSEPKTTTTTDAPASTACAAATQEKETAQREQEQRPKTKDEGKQAPNAAKEEGELTKEQREELKKKKREEFQKKQKEEFERREEKRKQKKAEESNAFIELLQERMQRAKQFNGPFILSDGEKQRVRECGEAARFGVSESAPIAAATTIAASIEDKKRMEEKKRSRAERFGDALKPLHPAKKQNAAGNDERTKNLTNYNI
jgi:hypothetical protein